MLPSYILKNEKDEDVDVASLTAENGVVFFLVPKADTRASASTRVPLAFRLTDVLYKPAVPSKLAASVTAIPTSHR